jgi:hypothetical protein
MPHKTQARSPLRPPKLPRRKHPSNPAEMMELDIVGQTLSFGGQPRIPHSTFRISLLSPSRNTATQLFADVRKNGMWVGENSCGLGTGPNPLS